MPGKFVHSVALIISIYIEPTGGQTLMSQYALETEEFILHWLVHSRFLIVLGVHICIHNFIHFVLCGTRHVQLNTKQLSEY